MSIRGSKSMARQIKKRRARYMPLEYGEYIFGSASAPTPPNSSMEEALDVPFICASLSGILVLDCRYPWNYFWTVAYVR
jgi:hypothetical protein